MTPSSRSTPARLSDSSSAAPRAGCDGSSNSAPSELRLASRKTRRDSPRDRQLGVAVLAPRRARCTNWSSALIFNFLGPQRRDRPGAVPRCPAIAASPCASTRRPSLVTVDAFAESQRGSEAARRPHRRRTCAPRGRSAARRPARSGSAAAGRKRGAGAERAGVARRAADRLRGMGMKHRIILALDGDRPAIAS